jgi:ornithine cyclodeaminase
MSGVLFLGHDDVRAALQPGPCAEAMDEVLTAHARGEAYFPLRNIAAPPGANGFIGLMPGWRGSHGDTPAAFGLKAIVLIPSNPARGLDAHQGLVMLFDGETGIPTAILDASAVTEIRTAAVTAIATKALARTDAATLAILGAGVQARSHLKALSWLAEARIYAPNTEHAEAVAAADPRATVSDSAEEAVRGADVVVTATSSREPVLNHAWLKEGAHINAVGASQPSAREIEVETVAAAALFCDSRESLRNEAGEFRLALERGVIESEDHVRAELGEVLTGLKPGRTDDGELTLFRSLGLAIEDLAAAQTAVAHATAEGIGIEVEL